MTSYSDKTRTYLAAWLARQVSGLWSRLGVAPVYLDGGALVVTPGVAIGHIGASRPGPRVAPAPEILVTGHRSGQLSQLNIVSHYSLFSFHFSLSSTPVLLTAVICLFFGFGWFPPFSSLCWFWFSNCHCVVSEWVGPNIMSTRLISGQRLKLDLKWGKLKWKWILNYSSLSRCSWPSCPNYAVGGLSKEEMLDFGSI